MRDNKKRAHVVNVCAFDCSICNVVNPNSTLCRTHDNVYIGVTMLCEECVCPKPKLQEWHKLECLMGVCGECGTHFAHYPNESLLSIDWSVSWKCFQ
jgi:hypothetical protein